MRVTDQRCVSAAQREDGSWYGVEMVNHPAPSGFERWLPTYSDSRAWPDSETAIREFKAILPEPCFLKNKESEGK
jgi:hypothetical protein